MNSPSPGPEVEGFQTRLTAQALLRAALLLLVGLMACGDDGNEPCDVLVFSRTLGFRHESIAAGTQMLTEEASTRGWTIEFTEEPGSFSDAGLSEVEVVVFLNTTGDVLGPEEERAFESWMGDGGGFVGIHSAADTEYDWPWYGRLVGTYFESHPSIQNGLVLVEESNHATTAHLPASWSRRDEWYNFRDNPRSVADVLLVVDESSYEGGDMGDDHPVSWHQSVAGGRSFYTALGHTSESYADPLFRQHIAAAIDWASGQTSEPR